MKILMYSDLHISRTSSIMPMIDNSIYTYRQQMILELGKYLSELAKEKKPDVIINLGDTFDQNTITSYDVNVASGFFNSFSSLDIPHLVIVGNHEMINANFNAVEILSNINNIVVIDEPSSLDMSILVGNNTETTKLAFLPYCNFNEVLTLPEGEFLFSHQDIAGMSIRGDFTMPEGLEQGRLLQKYRYVFNGHIHKPSIENHIINVGSISTHSFADDNETVPQCYIFDTNTLDLQIFRPTCCPLFRSMKVESIEELRNYLNGLDKNYMYILKCTCPYEIKSEVKELLSRSEDLILSYRIVAVSTSSNSVGEETEQKEIEDLVSNIDVKDSFQKFLKTQELKYPLDMYINLLKEVEIKNEL